LIYKEPSACYYEEYRQDGLSNYKPR
jgi:hypothetical protein